MTRYRHLRGLLPCVSGVCLVLASAAAATAQVEFHYQYWRNKLGADEDENAPQLLVIWRF